MLLSVLRFLPPIRDDGLPNLSFRVFASFLIGRKFVIFIWPELVEPVGDDGALRNDEMFFEQHGLISSSMLLVEFRKKFVNSFSDGCVDDVSMWLLDEASPFILPPMLLTFDTLIFLRGIWLTRPAPTAATEVDAVNDASHKTFFFLAELKTFTSFFENAWIFPIGLIFVPKTFAGCVKPCTFELTCRFELMCDDELLDGDGDTLFSFETSCADVAGSIKVVWRFLLAFVNCEKMSSVSFRDAEMKRNLMIQEAQTIRK